MQVAECVKQFADEVFMGSRSASSVKAYTTVLKQFGRFLGMEPEEMLERARSGRLRPEIELMKWLRSSHDRAWNTRLVRRSAVKKFFEVNMPESDFAWHKVKLGRKMLVVQDRVPTKDELLRMLAVANLRGRVAMTALVSSGIRCFTLAGLRLKDIDLESYPDVGVIRVPAELNKARLPYTTFMSSQAKMILGEYLKVRKRRGETLSPESPILEWRGRPVRSRSASWLWGSIVDRTGLGERSHNVRMLRAHTARKFFATALTRCGVSASARERLLGHFSGFASPMLALDSSYYRPYEEDLLIEYRRAAQQLIISEEANMEAAEKRHLLNVVKGLSHLPDEKKKAIENLLAKSKTVAEAMEKIREIARPKQLRVSAPELDDYLARGYKVIARIPPNSFVVEEPSI